jgi:hypothetical protein
LLPPNRGQLVLTACIAPRQHRRDGHNGADHIR